MLYHYQMLLPISFKKVAILIVIEYCKHHKDDPAPPPEDENKPKTSDDIDDWDREFINVDQGTLFEIILAANYLDIQLLLDLGYIVNRM